MEKYYKTVITVTVLSNEPVESMELEEVTNQIIHGDYSGQVDFGESKEISRDQMKAELIEQDSDPGFLISNERDSDG